MVGGGMRKLTSLYRRTRTAAPGKSRRRSRRRESSPAAPSREEEEEEEQVPQEDAAYPQCWEQMVDRWCSREWEETHNLCRERCLMMTGVAHHQDSRSLSGYTETWVRKFIYLF